MALNFPISPTLNQTYAVGTKTWKWNGYAWDLQPDQTLANDISAAWYTANSAYTQANLAYVQANTGISLANNSWYTANSAYAQANTGTLISQLAYNYANTIFYIATQAYTQANTGVLLANNSWYTANLAYAQSNTAISLANNSWYTANSAYAQANNGISLANTGISLANNSWYTANLAYVQANTGILLANNSWYTANLAYVQANNSFLTGNDAFAKANTALSTANLAYIQANSAISIAQTAYNVANVAASNSVDQYARNTANSSWQTANAAYSQANTGTSIAQAAYDYANVLVLSGGTLDQYARNTANSGLQTANLAYVQANTATSIAQAAYNAANTIVLYDQNLNTSNTVSFAELTVTGNTNTKHIIPIDNLAYDIGSPSLRYRDLYLSGNTLNLGNAQVSTINNSIYLTSLNIGNVEITIDANTGYLNFSRPITVSGNNVSVTGNVSFDDTTIFADSGSSLKLKSSNSIWYFTNTNSIIFPNGSTQNTAWNGITTGLIDDGGNVSNTVNNVTSLRFDSNSGFDVIGLGNGLAKVKINSTFKFWKIDGQDDLIAYGLDTIRFIAGTGIAITTNANTNPKSITFTNTSLVYNQNLNTTSNVTFNTVSHSGLVMTQGTNVDQLYEINALLRITENWQDTPIYSTSLPTGTYIVQVKANDNIVGGGHVNEYYTGLMSWYSSDTDSTIFDEIILHRAGQGPGSGALFLRVQRTETSNDKDLKLQISGTINCTASVLYTFKFRRMI
jgi:hypothetical protein